MFSLSACLYLSAFLFSVGIYGVLARRNILVILMSLELMLNAVNLALVTVGDEQHHAFVPALCRRLFHRDPRFRSA